MDRRRFLALGVAVGLGGWPSLATADTHPYAVTPEAGPWLIFVKSYTGPMAQTLTHELVSEIRQGYRLPAYYFNRGAEQREEERQRVQRLLQQQEDFLRQMNLPPSARRGVKTIRYEEQFAVLVGGYRTMDDARQALEGIRKLPPPDNKYLDVGTTIQPVGGTDGPQVQYTYLNPFVSAFVVPNPAVDRPDHDPFDRINDPDLVELNSGEDYSLLDNPQPWTLAVRVYNAPSVVQRQHEEDGGFLERIGLGGGDAQKLMNLYADQARAVTQMLRSMPGTPYEAYVLHTRYSSIVCVGGFERPDDPMLRSLQGQLANLQLKESSRDGVPTGRVLDTLSPNPMPMPVPKVN